MNSQKDIKKEKQDFVIITGAGSGIGKAVAVRLAQEGFRVGIMGRNERKLVQSMQLLKRSGYDCLMCRADVRDKREVTHAIRSLTKHKRNLRGVVACAGIGGSNKPSGNDRWDNVIRTNLYGTYYTFSAAINFLDENTEIPCHLIAISSLLARIGVANYTAYCAAKAGILGLVRALAIELADQGIRVNAICPGWVDTPMARKGIRKLAVRNHIPPSQGEEYALNSVPLHRMSSPAEIAEIVAFMFGQGGNGFTGQAFDVNNGVWMG